MKLLVRNIFLAATFLLASAAANAVSVTLVDVANSEVRSGAYAGFYTLTIDAQTILGMCDDFNTHSGIGETWTGIIYNYSDIVGGSGKFGPNLVKYSQVGYLFSLTGASTFSQQASIDEAIWKIMDASAPALSGAALAYYTTATSGAFNAFDFTNYMRVLTPIPPSASQEFLIGVPVPAAAWLFGSGLVSLAGLRARKAKHS